ncbi:MAG: hypothetical protein H7145_21780 [Akkermansiaceae bacterium]|nr:hypothetical protein [Armatimonadota bacterium]
MIIAGVLLLPVFLLSVAVVLGSMIPSPAQRALPATATHVQEYYDSDLFSGDYTRFIKARIPEKEVAIFANKMGVSERYSARKHANLPVVIPSGDAPWWNPWNPTTRLEGALFSCPPGKDKSVVALYSNGYLYYCEYKW